MKVSYANMKLKIDNSVNKFEFAGQEIEVLKYLNIKDKYDLVMITLEKAKNEEIYNELLLDTYFHLNLVYMYTNISFTDKQREDEFKLYDNLKSNGFFEKFLNALEDDEYEFLYEMMEIIKEDSLSYNTTAASVVQRLIVDLPKNMEAAKEIIDTFNPEAYEQVTKLAKATGFR